jgi:DNA-binding MarR family transcriptional regulator
MKAERSSDVPLARLSAMVFRTLVDDLHARLEKRGFRDVGSTYGFVLLEARKQSLAVTDVARLMGVTKQAASKLVASMLRTGYLKAVSTRDARERRVELSVRGKKLLATVEDIYRELEAEWASVIGRRRVETLRSDLVKVLVARHGALPSVRPTR